MFKTLRTFYFEYQWWK